MSRKRGTGPAGWTYPVGRAVWGCPSGPSFVTPCKILWTSWTQPGLEKFQGMQQWSTKPEEACNCYPSRSPHFVDGIRTLIVPCAQWQQQLPLVECPLSALLRAFCSSDTRHYSWRTMLFASCQVWCLAFEEELTVPLKHWSFFTTPLSVCILFPVYQETFACTMRTIETDKKYVVYHSFSMCFLRCISTHVKPVHSPLPTVERVEGSWRAFSNW